MVGSRSPIAIVGMGAVLPGAADLGPFWRLVAAGESAARRVPEGRWTLPVEEALAEAAAPDRVYSPYGCFLDDEQTSAERLREALRSVGATDAGRLSNGAAIDVDLLARLDPLYRLLLIAGCQAWSDAAMAALDRSRVGVIVGNIALPTVGASKLAKDALLNPSSLIPHSAPRAPRPAPRSINRYVAGLPAELLAATLGLRGGAYALDAACASSLYAVKLAVDELQAGRADAMLAGGVSRPDCLYTQMGFSQLRALSKSGRCAPFDHRADGLVVGEGAGVFVLKRLADALAHGDHVYAVIAGCGLSNDVGGNLMSPDSEGQLRAMQAAYREAGFAPDEVDLIECHGTGTPIGDAVEYRSLRGLWRDAKPGRRCAIGSVKSNVGHLLTGAGAAGLVKTLLALKHETLPPSANFERPARDVAFGGGPFQVLAKAAPWPERPDGRPRRAAVSAFGFGGINAHLVLEEWRERGQWAVGSGKWTVDSGQWEVDSGQARSLSPAARNDPRPLAPSPQPPPVAVVGLAAHVGPWKDVDAIAGQLFGDDALAGETGVSSQEDAAPESRIPNPVSRAPRPAPGVPLRIPSLDVPLDRYRIPPAELAEMLPQQLLMLEVAYAAMEDAGMAIDKAPHGGRLDMGVFVGIELDMNTTNFHLRWAVGRQTPRASEEGSRIEDGGSRGIADFHDPSLHPPSSILDPTTTQLRDAISPPLSANRTMGALGGIVASRVARLLRVGGPSFAVSSEETSGLHGVLAAKRALERGELRVALAGAVDLPCDVRAMLCRTEGDAENIADGAAAVILKRLDDALADGDHVYCVLGDSATTSGGPIGAADAAGGSDAGRLGDCGAARGIVSLVAGCLALDRRRRPLSPTVRKPQYWLHNRADGPRRATIAARSVGGGEVRVALVEAAARRATRGAGRGSDSLFLVCGNGADEVVAALDHLESQTRAYGCASLHALAARAWREGNAAWTSGEGRLCVSLIARDRSELHALIAEAREAVRGGRPLHRDNIAYSPTPLLGRRGARPWTSLAFVYPGAGSQFLGMGRDWAVDWPDVMERLHRENERLADQFAAGKFWTASSRDEISEADVAFGQVWLGALVTDVLARFGVRPGAAIGYSLGESAALFSLRAWRDRDEMLRRMETSPLFTTELAGPCLAARRTWNLPEDEAVDWRIGMVDRPADVVRRAIADHSRGRQQRVYLLIVNTPRECVVGGQRTAVEQLVADLDCAWHGIDGVTTVHCEVAQCVADDYRGLHLLPTFPPEGLRFYSGSWGRGYDLSREAAADSIVAQAVAPFDFTRVIESAYDDGVRFFLEIGPGASCTRMIGDTLAASKQSESGGEREHVAIPLCVASQRSHATLLRALGTLAAEGYPVDLAPLYENADAITGRHRAQRARQTMQVAAHWTPVDVVTLAKSFTASPSVSTRREPSVAWGGTGGSSTCAESQSDADLSNPAEDLAVSAVPNESIAANTTLLAAAERQSTLVARVVETQREKSLTEEQFLHVASGGSLAVARARAWQAAFTVSVATPRAPESRIRNPESRAPRTESPAPSPQPPAPVLNRQQCLEFATGSIAAVLGPAFAEADTFPTRVRLPDEPLMLVDRILEIEGEPLSLTSGCVVTEHDVLDGTWYLDAGRIPTCIAVEAGQADLFLSGYLGIDLRTRGLAVYRLLDAVVTFHGPLPTAGATIHYDIRIERFFRQGETHLFRFRFDATVFDDTGDGRPLLTMREGCAGFFTAAELAAGQGIVQTTLDRREQSGVTPDDWRELAPLGEVESYSDEQIAALRAGDLAGCFGDTFADLDIECPATLPGGRMTLVHRVLRLDPAGGRFGLGQIVGEADIRADDWFLTCHFVDDQVMPGTLMYECCLHTLRIYLMRMGWIAEAGRVAYEPVPEVSSQLKCRGQVTAATRRVQYEITIKELGYQGDDATAYVLADALMYADGKPIVQMNNMSLRMSGARRKEIERLWRQKQDSGSRIQDSGDRSQESGVAETEPAFTPTSNLEPPTSAPRAPRPAPLFDRDRILAFAIGKPSVAFGEPYRVFDDERVIARLPGPPYQFLDRITSIEGCRPFELAAGGEIDAEYDVPADAWYFAAEGQPTMPLAVLLEVALQPCGWLAAYVGSALASSVDLSFRNLGGRGVQRRAVDAASGTLATRVKMTSVFKSGGMIIQNYDMTVRDRWGIVYEGDTYFGFFSKQALAHQIGIRDATPYEPSDAERGRTPPHDYPTSPPLPDDMMRMVDRIEVFDPQGGPAGLGIIRGTTAVNPDAWFFKAHFYQDPVWPGSLGLESLLQLLKYVAVHRWGGGQHAVGGERPVGGESLRRGVGLAPDRRKDSPPTAPDSSDDTAGGRSGLCREGVAAFESMALDVHHTWTYRGQILPTDRQVVVQAAITTIDDVDRRIEADGCLWVDGRLIYQMERFGVRMRRKLR